MNRYSYLIFDIPFVIFQFLIFKLHENKNINITMSQNSLIQFDLNFIYVYLDFIYKIQTFIAPAIF